MPAYYKNMIKGVGAKTLEQWSGTMTKRPQMIDGGENIIKDSKLKLPSYQYTVLFNSPQFQVDRDVANMEMLAKKHQDARVLHEEVIETARDTGTNFHDVHNVAEAIRDMTNMG